MKFLKNTFLHRIPLVGASVPYKGGRKLKDRNDETLGFDLALLARITLALTSSSAIIVSFQKASFQGFNVDI